MLDQRSPTQTPELAFGQRPASRTVFLETFGCQMNELDSELVTSHLKALGYGFTSDPGSANVILYNTCSVREQAENKVWSRVGIMGLRKKQGEQFILGVIGCMAEREGSAMIRRFPQIDLMCGPGELDKLPMLIDNAFKTEAADLAERVALQGNNARRSSTLTAATDNLEMLDLSRAFDPNGQSSGGKTAYVRITRGCNKFCTYCVVPYTRGAEVHRPPDSIIDECKKLADHGVIEITLLGQTVNHYVYVHGAAVTVGGGELPQIGPAFKNGRAKPQAASNNPKSKTQNPKSTTFAHLLHRIHEEVPAIQRLRFVTSFPRDFGDDILEVMAASPRICRYLHVPAQSGSNRILKLMNRGYTAEEYLAFIDRAKAHLPGATIAGDFIVGFPTETDEDFEQTKALLRRVEYKNSFIFKYSPRPGTVAIDRFKDDVPDDVKRRRNNQLLALQAEVSAMVHQRYVGTVIDVFVEQITGRSKPPPAKHNGTKLTIKGQSSDPRKNRGTRFAGELGSPSHNGHAATPDRAPKPTLQFSGRTEGDLIAVFEVNEDCLPHPQAPQAMLGRIVPVNVESAGPLLLRGTLVGI